MNNNSIDRIQLIEDETPASDLHEKIMRRVLFTHYGRYIYICTGVISVNLVVLGMELYRNLVERFSSPAQIQKFPDTFAWSVEYMRLIVKILYDVLPLQSIIATVITAGLCAYMIFIFVRFHSKKPESFSLFGNRLVH